MTPRRPPRPWPLPLPDDYIEEICKVAPTPHVLDHDQQQEREL
jgi:hypothetical protein